jgi:hypothetical protein
LRLASAYRIERGGSGQIDARMVSEKKSHWCLQSAGIVKFAGILCGSLIAHPKKQNPKRRMRLGWFVP